MDTRQYLREATLKTTEGQPVQQRANALNLIEAILEGEDVDEIVEKVASGTLTEYYRPQVKNSASSLDTSSE